jgi:hypothetical protein
MGYGEKCRVHLFMISIAIRTALYAPCSSHFIPVRLLNRFTNQSTAHLQPFAAQVTGSAAQMGNSRVHNHPSQRVRVAMSCSAESDAVRGAVVASAAVAVVVAETLVVEVPAAVAHDFDLAADSSLAGLAGGKMDLATRQRVAQAATRGSAAVEPGCTFAAIAVAAGADAVVAK